MFVSFDLLLTLMGLDYVDYSKGTIDRKMWRLPQGPLRYWGMERTNGSQSHDSRSRTARARHHPTVVTTELVFLQDEEPARTRGVLEVGRVI